MLRRATATHPARTKPFICDHPRRRSVAIVCDICLRVGLDARRSLLEGDRLKLARRASRQAGAVVPPLRAPLVYHRRHFGVQLEARTVAAPAIHLKRRRGCCCCRTSRNLIHSMLLSSPTIASIMHEFRRSCCSSP